VGVFVLAVIGIVVAIAAGGGNGDDGRQVQVAIPADTPTNDEIRDSYWTSSCQPLEIPMPDEMYRAVARPQKVGFEDPRFDWKGITDGNNTIHFYGDIELAKAAISGIREGSSRIDKLLMTSPKSLGDIFLYTDSYEMAEVAPSTHRTIEGYYQLAAHLPDGVGTLIAGQTVSDVASITVWMLAEATVMELSGLGEFEWPVTGLSAYLSCFTSAYEAGLRSAIIADEVIPLGEQAVSLNDAVAQQGQDLSVVEFLISTYGEEQVPRLLEAINELGDIDLGLQYVYGFSQSDLDREWRLSLGLDPLPATPATNRPVPPTERSVPPTERPVPPTEKSVPPTERPVPPTAVGAQTLPPQSGTATARGPVKQFIEVSGVRIAQYSSVPPVTIDTAAHYTATMRTSLGNMEIELFAAEAPVTVNNFIFLAVEGFYNNVVFHRVIPSFMIQGGDPLGRGTGGPGYKFQDEFVASLTFDQPGKLAMANSGPTTNGSQFFVTVAPTPHLNGAHTIFGQITQGQNVADAISLAQTGPNNNPVTPIVILGIDIAKNP
jgi:cyclophilin family peptidyl-prolyl cis-trans isomerase